MTFDTYGPEPWHGKCSIFLTYLIWASSHHIDNNWILSHWRYILTGGLKRNSVLNYQLVTIESFPTVIRDDGILILNVEPYFLLFQNEKIGPSLWTSSWNVEGSVCTKYYLHSTYVASMYFPPCISATMSFPQDYRSNWGKFHTEKLIILDKRGSITASLSWLNIYNMTSWLCALVVVIYIKGLSIWIMVLFIFISIDGLIMEFDLLVLVTWPYRLSKEETSSNLDKMK